MEGWTIQMDRGPNKQPLIRHNPTRQEAIRRVEALVELHDRNLHYTVNEETKLITLDASGFYR